MELATLVMQFYTADQLVNATNDVRRTARVRLQYSIQLLQFALHSATQLTRHKVWFHGRYDVGHDTQRPTFPSGIGGQHAK